MAEQIVVAPSIGRTPDWANPLLRGLVGAWLFNDGAGTSAPDMGPNGLTGSITNTAMTKSVAQGLSNSTNSITGGAVIPASPVLSAVSGDVTAAVIVRLTATPSNTMYLLLKWANSSPFIYPCGILVTAAGIVNWQISDGTTTCDAQSTASVIDGKPHIIMGTRKGNLSSLYIDGVLISTATASLGSTANTSGLGLGNDPAAIATKPIVGSMRGALLWNRALAADEVASFAVSPYRMFARKPLLYKSSAASPITGAPSAATSTWTALAAAVALGGVTAAPSHAASTWTAVSPSVAVGAATASPASATSSWTAKAPSPSVGGITAAPAVAISTWAAVGPVAGTGTSPQSGTPSAATSTWTVPSIAPALGGIVASPAVAQSAWTTTSPSVTLGNTTASPSAATSLWVAKQPGTNGSTASTPTPAVSTWVARPPAVSMGQVTASPAAATCAWTANSPTATATGNATAQAQAALSQWVVPGATTTGAPTPLKATRVFAGPLIRATRVYAGPLVRVTRVEIFPN